MLYCHGSFRWGNVEKAQELAKGSVYFCFHPTYQKIISVFILKFYGFDVRKIKASS